MRYKAFISYAHAGDRPLAKSLQNGLQLMGKPWFRMRTFSIFRDETDLTASPHLWKTIEKALDESEFLMLFGSPKAA